MDIPNIHDHIPSPDPAPTTSHPDPSIPPTLPDLPSPAASSPQIDSPDAPQPSSTHSSALTLTDHHPNESLPPSHSPPLPQPPSSSLDQEIVELKKTLGGVSATLGGWWGMVQKQSVEALAASNITAQLNTARNELASLNLIEKAKREVERLGEHAKEGYAAVSSELGSPQPAPSMSEIPNADPAEAPALKTDSGAEQPERSSPKGKERALEPDPEASPALGFDGASLSSFFSKLSKDSEKLTASLHSTLTQLPTAVQSANLSRLTAGGKFDLAEVQKLAEGYLAKGEVYLQDVGKELREIVQDAVKVIPPPEDGPVEQASRPSMTTSDRSQSELAHQRRLLETKREALVSKLRRDEALILADPKLADSTLASAFEEFTANIARAGGLDGEAWKKKIKEELGLDEPDGAALKTMFENLVPAKMSSEEFWARYFFRMDRIDQEEASRRVVLSAAHEENEGDFSWDMEDESEPASPAIVVKPEPTRGPLKTEEEARAQTPTLAKLGTFAGPPAVAETAEIEASRGSTPKQIPGHTSGRDSSEEGTADSFDVVSAQQSADEKPKTEESGAGAKEEDEDSDWE